jgi:hypothetical protein
MHDYKEDYTMIKIYTIFFADLFADVRDCFVGLRVTFLAAPPQHLRSLWSVILPQRVGLRATG